MLTIYIWEIPDCNLGRDSGYPDWHSSWVSSVSPNKYRDTILKYIMADLFNMHSNPSFI
jgi:hypothetical protein